MTSLYTELDAVGFPKVIVNIIVEYDDDPLCIKRIKDGVKKLRRLIRETQEK